MAEEASVRFRE